MSNSKYAEELKADFKARPPGTVPVNPDSFVVHAKSTYDGGY